MSKTLRRQFLAGTGALLIAPLLRAQQAQFRIGVLQIGKEADISPINRQFLAGLHDRGYVIGKNLSVEFRYTDAQNLLAAAQEVLALKPDLLAGTEITSVVMKARTSTIPIVMLNSADPVAAGLVKSLGRPGTNVTGMSFSMFALVAKHIELLAEMVPNMARVGLLTGPFDPPKNSPYYGRPDSWELAARQAAEAKGLSLIVTRASDAASLREAFATLKSQLADGLMVATNSLVLHMHAQVIDAIRQLRIPSVSGYSQFVRSGGLLSYGPDYRAVYRYAAKFVDLIFRGAKPADLPVEQVSQFELLFNRKTERELGLKIPQSVLVRVDEVIE